MKKIALIGSTGSIGRQVLACVDRHKDEFTISSLAAGSNAELLSEQIDKYSPSVAAIADPAAAMKITRIPSTTVLYTGPAATLHAVAAEADVVFVAAVGFCGLEAVIEAIKADKIIALANKEALVAGGAIVKKLLAEHPKAKIIPVDSEHSAVWQSLGFDVERPYKRIILTASGGALRDMTAEQMKNATAKEALRHPNWKMGAKITVDCATMVNKGFEVIEAMWLFGAPMEKISVVIHPESVVHSLVEFEDGAIVCEMANPDMEIPIQLALTYPDRLSTGAGSLDLTAVRLTFDKVDEKKYPCFPLVLETAKAGGYYPCALSAANEEAVKAFLNGKIRLGGIYSLIGDVLSETLPSGELNYETLKAVDAAAREKVARKLKTI